MSCNLNDRLPVTTSRATKGDRVWMIFEDLSLTKENILEFAAQHPGQYMFHHHRDHVVEHDCTVFST